MTRGGIDETPSHYPDRTRPNLFLHRDRALCGQYVGGDTEARVSKRFAPFAAAHAYGSYERTKGKQVLHDWAPAPINVYNMDKRDYL